jgi:hypothetical protein
MKQQVRTIFQESDEGKGNFDGIPVSAVWQ